MHSKFLKFFALVILIITSFFFGKHLIINAQTGSNSVTVNCSSGSICNGSTAHIFVPQGGCPSGNEDCGKETYKQDKTIEQGTGSVTLTGIPDGSYRVTLTKNGYVSDPRYAEVSLNSSTPTGTGTFSLSLDTSKIDSFKATPSTINKGSSSSFSWSTQNFLPNTCSIDKGVGPVPNNGQNKTVTPTATTTYTLSCFNSASVKKTATATVTVNGTGGGGGGGGSTDPALTLGSNTVQAGKSIKVSWSNIPNPSTKDYISISPFATDNSYNWDYLNDNPSVGPCLNSFPQTPTTNGSCSFTVASSATPGTYTFKYAKYESDTTWDTSFLTSSSFTITSNIGGGGTGGGGGGGGGTGTGGGASCSGTNVVGKTIDLSPRKPSIFTVGDQNAISLYGEGAKRRLAVGHNFGYSIVDLSNINSPSVIGHHNMILDGGGGPFFKGGDGQSTVNGLRVARDGSRMLVGWSDLPDGLISMRDIGSADGVFQAQGNSAESRPLEVNIVKRPDGKYIGFGLYYNGIIAVNMTDPLPRTDGGYPAAYNPVSYFVSETQKYTYGSTPRLQVAGNYVGYVGERNTIILVDASKPLGDPNIAENFTTKVISAAELGYKSSDYYIDNFAMTADLKDPSHIYIFVNLTKMSNSAPGPIAVAEYNANGTVKPVAGSPINPPAPFVGTGSSNAATRPYAYTNTNGYRAFFVRSVSNGNQQQSAFINITFGQTLTAGVTTYVGREPLQIEVFEENNKAYIFGSLSVDPEVWQVNCSTPSTSPSVKIDSFKATPAIIGSGESSKLSWKTSSTFPAGTGRNYVTLNGEPVAEEGDVTVTPPRVTNYTLKISRSDDSTPATTPSVTEYRPGFEKLDLSINKPSIFAFGFNEIVTIGGKGADRIIAVKQDFGYTTLSAANPAHPTVAGHHNMTTNGNPKGGPFEKHGDGQTVVTSLSLSSDAEKMIVGWADIPDNNIILNRSGNLYSAGGQFGGPRAPYAEIIKRPDGKYLAFAVMNGFIGLHISNVSDPLPITDGSYPPQDSLPSESIEIPLQRSNLAASGNYLGYTLADGSISVVDVSKPLGSSIVDSLVFRKFTLAQLGVSNPSNYFVNSIQLSSPLEDPSTVYIFLDLINKTHIPASYVVVKMSNDGVITPVGSVSPSGFSGTGSDSLSSTNTASYRITGGAGAVFARSTATGEIGLINLSVKNGVLKTGVARIAKSGTTSYYRPMSLAAFEENGIVYVYGAHGTMVTATNFPAQTAGSSTSGLPSTSCTAPNCASAMRVVTVRREGGGGTGGGGADDGTGGRNLFWWLKYYLNL